MRIMGKVQCFLSVTVGVLMSSSVATQQMIVAHDHTANDQFGYSVAIHGKTLLVGAHKADINGQEDAGAAYVYGLDKGRWNLQGKLIATPHFAEDTLGGSVALHDDFAILGAMRRDQNGKDSGAVVVFQRHMDSWQQMDIFAGPDTQEGDGFGQSIAVTEDYLVIGAPRHDAKGLDAGAVYVYRKVSDTWQYQAKVVGSDSAAGDLFGISVAIDGQTLVVGADLHDVGADDAGATYVFVLEQQQWKQQAKLVASDPGPSDIFGVRVAIAKDTILVSARRDDIDGVGKNAGSVYVFMRDDDSWKQHSKLLAPDGNADDRFGRGVAVNGHTALISAMHHDENGTDSGAVYVYTRNTDGWSLTSQLFAHNAMPGDRFGWNIALSKHTAAIATPHRDSVGGAVYIEDLGEATTLSQ